MSADAENGRDTPRIPTKEALTPPLPKRFYKEACVAAHGAGFAVVLDGRPVKTPGKRTVAVPSATLAEALAAEWRAQGTHIDPATMPMTRIVNSALDGVAQEMAAVAADIVKYAGSDLVCYRAEAPQELVALQAAAWDGVLAATAHDLGAPFIVAKGITFVAQRQASLEAVARSLDGIDAIRLAALHVMTTLTGSALIALAHARGALTAEAAWAAAHVDEDWQISQWGDDAEAEVRRERRRADMMAAARVLALAGTAPGSD